MKKNNEEPLFFYHLIDKQHKKSEGIVSLEYMYKNNKNLFIKNTEKYRNRLCNDWGIYPDKNPKDLTLKEIHDGINKFRIDENGNNYIYFFRYPPYKSLDRQFQEIYKDKKIYRINLNDPELRKIILNIDYGWKNSHRDEESRSLEYYQNISVADYFGEFNSKNKLLFSSLSHISISVKNGIIPFKFITEISIPNSIDDIKKEEENVTESVAPNHVKNKHAFHLSERDLSGTTISPRIPSYLSDPIKVKEHKKLGLYEDSSIKRVCVSFSIDNSLKALLPDITEHPERKNEVIGRVFNVHITEKPFSLYKHINNRKIVNDKLVFDVKITKENWILEPVKLIKIGKIQVIGVKKSKIKRVNNNSTMRVQEFEWKWIEKERVSDIFKSNIKREDNSIHESVLESTERNTLKNKSFGLPSLRKYPLNDKNHVIQAIRMFNHVDNEFEKELAGNIIYAMKKYKIPKTVVGERNRLQTYL